MPPLPRFSTLGVTELEKDSDLALFLLNHIEACRDAASGAWHGERETRRLQNTCHAAEALSELNLSSFSARLIEPALKWLIELPLLRDVLPQDRYAVRVYPVRFKTLAALHRFDDTRLQNDFNDLLNHFDSQTGWLLDTPNEFKTSLASLIAADTLVELNRPHPLLDSVEGAFKRWLDSNDHDVRGRGNPTAITNYGDAAYAFDVLTRANRLIPDSIIGKQTREALIDSLTHRRSDEHLKRAIYSALQLARHFADHAAARAAVADLLRAIRSRYETGAFSHQPTYFHAIVLRLLNAFYQNQLRDSIFESLWVHHQQIASHAENDLEQRQHEALAHLIHNHVAVKLGQVQRLSGTRTRAVVYRVNFSLNSDATDHDGRPFAILPDSLRLIIKQGSIESLSRTIKRCNELPAHLRPYFAKHSSQPETSSDSEWYLAMEDLVGMSPLSEMLDRLDLRSAGRNEHDQIARAAASIGEALRALHTHRRRPPAAGNVIHWLYLNPISESIQSVCESLPELKSYSDHEFESNGATYHPLNFYLGKLSAHAGELTPPALGAVHGDCHSRNLMIDDKLDAVKFIDLETISFLDDYLIDYGQLLEDVALYRFLPRGQRPNSLTADEIFADGKHLDYPHLPRDADSILFFEKCIVEQIEKFARETQDPNFKPRLWLAVVRNLIQLADRQLPITHYDTYRLEERLKLVLVSYAESVRLLAELVNHLEATDRNPLGELPFT